MYVKGFRHLSVWGDIMKTKKVLFLSALMLILFANNNFLIAKNNSEFFIRTDFEGFRTLLDEDIFYLVKNEIEENFSDDQLRHGFMYEIDFQSCSFEIKEPSNLLNLKKKENLKDLYIDSFCTGVQYDFDNSLRNPHDYLFYNLKLETRLRKRSMDSWYVIYSKKTIKLNI
jgi:hypothetical protein